MKKRRKFTDEFKSKVALEALREQQPIHEIAQRYEVHPTQVTKWKKALLANAATVFGGDRTAEEQRLKQKKREDRLYKHIGQLEMEVVLPRKSGHLERVF